MMIRFIFILIPFFVFAQNKDYTPYNNKGLSFKVQSFNLFYSYDGKPTYNTDFELNETSRIVGFQGEVNYFVSKYFAFGLGIGGEKLTQPEVKYYPAYTNFLAVFYNKKNSMYFKFNLGTHLGNLDKKGNFYRTGIGYRIRAYKNSIINIEGTYSNHFFYKKFQSSGRPVDAYSFDMLGITLGIEFNKFNND